LLSVLLLAVVAAAWTTVEPSVEWSVVNSDLVVRGRLTAVNFLRRKGNDIDETAVFRIDETLKGPALDTVRFELGRDASQPWVAEQRPLNVEMLCFLNRKGEGWELSEDEVDSLVRLDKALLRVFLEACKWPVDRDFPHKALGLALHRQAVGLAQHHTMDVFEPIAALLPLRDIATLDDLATELFGV